MRSKQSILKEVNAKYSLGGLLLKLQYFGHLMQRAQLIGKDPDGGKDQKPKRRGQQSMRWLNSVTKSVGRNLSKLQ